MANDIKRDIELGLNRLEWGNEGRAQHAVLEIETGKACSGGVESTATVYWISERSRSHTYGLGVKGDYRKRIVCDQSARATQKTIDRQYAAVFTEDAVAALVSEAKAHYDEKGVINA